MKLKAEGMAGYSLQYVNVRPLGGFVEYYEGEAPTGDLLQAYAAWGTPFYDQPMFHTPPLFAASLNLSHRLLAGKQPYQVLGRDGEKRLPVGQRVAGQFYACVVPVVSSLLLVAATCWLGRMMFGEAVGLLAALVVAVSPVPVLAGQRIWADATLAGLVTVAMGCAWAEQHAPARRWPGAWLAGLCLGLGLLTKMTAILVVPALIWTAAIGRWKWKSQTRLWVTAAVLAAPWFAAVWCVFGTPWFAPSQPGISQTHEWFAQINRLPWHTYLAGVPAQTPVLAVGYGMLVVGLVKRRPAESVLGMWWLVFLVGLTWLTSADEMLGPEHRYLLPAYPALAILSARGLWQARERLGRSGSWLVGALVTGSVTWSLWLAWRFRGFDEISFPF